MSLDLKCVNKVKIEEYKEFKNSIFSEVYEKAKFLVKDTIDENECNRNDADKFAEGDYICNIIAFVGKRGMGKSSAMLSFAYFLRDNSFFENQRFYVLPKIDMSMVTCNESLLDIVLAYMWSKYEEIDNELYTKDASMKSLKKKFIEVKDSYMRFKKANVKNYEEELYSVRELKSLAKSLHLRNSFSRLVSDFLERVWENKHASMKEKYLVFVIDDLDLVSDNFGEVLEQIKNFLSIPQVIVLTTLDIERGILNKRHELEKLFSGKYLFDDTEEKVLEYATDYMAKVIPFNKRIYMPDIREKSNGKKISIDINLYGDKLSRKGTKKVLKELDYERYCNLLLYKYADIITDPDMGCLFGEKESLRGIVNGLNALYYSLNDNLSHEENEINAKAWIKKEITVLAEKINSNELYSFYINNGKYPWHKFADFMIQSVYFYVKKGNFEYDYEVENINLDIPMNGGDYGDILAFFVRLKRELVINDWNNIKNVLWLYSVNYEMSGSENVFSKFVGEALGGIIEKNTYLPGVFNIDLKESPENELRFLNQDFKNLIELVKCTMFADIDSLVKSKIQMKNQPIVQLSKGGSVNIHQNQKNRHIYLNVESLIVKISFDNFIKNMCNYEKCCERVINWILDGIYGEQEIENKEERTLIYQKIYDGLNVDRWLKWKRKYKIYSFNDMFPLKSLGYMFGLAEHVDSELRKNPSNVFAVICKEVKESAWHYMKECEDYYFLESNGRQKSDAWKEMFDLVEIEKISMSRQKLMINSQLNENSTGVTM